MVDFCISFRYSRGSPHHYPILHGVLGTHRVASASFVIILPYATDEYQIEGVGVL